METPCINVCRVDPRTGLCAGCKRTDKEIKDWTKFTDEQRSAVMTELKTR
jgi:predicted Fe-S protein YdhL (DUF1289 family)